MSRFSSSSHPALSLIHSMLDNRLISSRSVATVDQILVPETLLKKRKSQEKAREERSAELEKKKKVSQIFNTHTDGIGGLL